jgi:hypothetical protein
MVRVVLDAVFHSPVGFARVQEGPVRARHLQRFGKAPILPPPDWAYKQLRTHKSFPPIELVSIRQSRQRLTAPTSSILAALASLSESRDNPRPTPRYFSLAIATGCTGAGFCRRNGFLATGRALAVCADVADPAVVTPWLADTTAIAKMASAHSGQDRRLGSDAGGGVGGS